MDPGGVSELDVMKQFRAAYSRLCHDAVVHAVHWECWVAAMRNVIALFSVATEWAEATACLSMPGASPGQCADALVVLRQMRDSTTGMQRRLEHLVLELRSGVEARQRVALALLLRWCGREPREGDFGRYVWGEAIGAAAASGQRPREVADGGGRVDVAEPTGHAADAAGRAAKCSGSPVTRRAPRRARAAAGVLLWMGAGTKALALAPSARSTVPALGVAALADVLMRARGAVGWGPAGNLSGTLPSPWSPPPWLAPPLPSSSPPPPPPPEPAAGGRAAPKLVSEAQAVEELPPPEPPPKGRGAGRGMVGEEGRMVDEEGQMVDVERHGRRGGTWSMRRGAWSIKRMRGLHVQLWRESAMMLV